MTYNQEEDCLCFDNCTHALKYFLIKVLNMKEQAIVESKNIVNKETYKKQIYELEHKFFCINNPKAVVYDLKNYKTFPWFLISEIISEVLNINPPVYSKYRDDIFSNAYCVQADGRCSYLYGSRFQEWNSLLKIYELLSRNPTSKGAVIPIFQNVDVGEHIKDKPCTTQYQFNLKNGKLNMFIAMRSWDFGPNGGWKYDFGLSSFILQSLASWLNVEAGKMYYYVKSLHIYEKDIQTMKNLKLYLDYHENDILMFEIDKNMNITKYYEDMRRLLEIEALSRNLLGNKALELINKLNYPCMRDFGRIYLLKNNSSNLEVIDELTKQMETSIKKWYEYKKE